MEKVAYLLIVKDHLYFKGKDIEDTKVASGTECFIIG